MDSVVRRKLEMAVRVRDFNRAHAFSDPSHGAVVTRFDEGLVKAQALAVQEQAGRLESAAASGHRREVRQEVERELGRYVARVAKLAARTSPSLEGRFQMPGSNASNALFLSRGWDLLNLAKANRDLLGEHGLAGTQLDDLAEALTRFEGATERANAGRRGHVGARAELLSVAAELMELVGLLEPLNQVRFRDDAENLAAWESARNVAGPFKGKAPPVGGVVPPGDGHLGKAA